MQRVAAIVIVSCVASDHVKAGLLVMVRSIEQIRSEFSDRIVEVLGATAGSAADAIDPNTQFVFQRAIIQEAFRSMVDSYLMLSMERSGRVRQASRER